MEMREEDRNREPTDEELMIGLGSGDMQALETLVARHRKWAYEVALGITGDTGAAMDVSQEAFIRLYRSVKRFRKDKKFFPWFYQILRNRALTELKKQQARRESPGGLDFPFQSDETGPANQSDLKRTVWKAIRGLPEGSKEIIILRHFNGLSYAEIAEVLSVPVGTVMSRLHAARCRLRDELEGEFP